MPPISSTDVKLLETHIKGLYRREAVAKEQPWSWEEIREYAGAFNTAGFLLLAEYKNDAELLTGNSIYVPLRDAAGLRSLLSRQFVVLKDRMESNVLIVFRCGEPPTHLTELRFEALGSAVETEHDGDESTRTGNKKINSKRAENKRAENTRTENTRARKTRAKNTVPDEPEASGDESELSQNESEASDAELRTDTVERSSVCSYGINAEDEPEPFCYVRRDARGHSFVARLKVPDPKRPNEWPLEMRPNGTWETKEGKKLRNEEKRYKLRFSSDSRIYARPIKTKEGEGTQLRLINCGASTGDTARNFQQDASLEILTSLKDGVKEKPMNEKWKAYYAEHNAANWDQCFKRLKSFVTKAGGKFQQLSLRAAYAAPDVTIRKGTHPLS